MYKIQSIEINRNSADIAVSTTLSSDASNLHYLGFFIEDKEDPENIGKYLNTQRSIVEQVVSFLRESFVSHKKINIDLNNESHEVFISDENFSGFKFVPNDIHFYRLPNYEIIK